MAGSPLPPIGSGRAESLLAYLLLHRHAPQPRRRLAFVLWPDSTEAQARTNLRHLLHILRAAVPDPDRFLDVTARTLQWRVDAPCWLDVSAFEEALGRAAKPATDRGLGALREAADLYTGDLLEGYYDDWALTERERLRRCYAEVLERLVSLLEAAGEHEAGIGYAERLLRLDPLRERAYRTLMRLHDQRGDRARALRVYHVCVTTLERELGVEPSAATSAAYSALLAAGTLGRDEQERAEPRGAHNLIPPLVGRTSEWERLTAMWRATEKGHAQLVLLTGEPGIGKTRLVDELSSWCAHRGASCAATRSYRAEAASTYGPVVTWLRSPDVRNRLHRLDAARRRELARLVPELAAEADLQDHEESADHEGERRQRLLDAAATALLAPGRRMLLVIDDIHWCDSETLQFLHYLLRIDPFAPLMVAATARSGETAAQHSLGEVLAGLYALDRVTEIEIGRFTREETGVLAAQIATGPLDERTTRRLFDDTGGNPLFVVEALRAGWQPGTGKPGWMSPKVLAVVESHLARVSEPARHLVSLAATLGQEFTADILSAASDFQPQTVVEAIDELWRHRIIKELGADSYDFSHDKVREVAYASLGPAQRRVLHLRIARALERVSSQDLAAVSGRLAAHYEQAGRAEAAASWYRRAAGAAQRLHANVEAVRLLERALDLLHSLPSADRSMAEELAVLTALPAPLGAIDGYASARVIEVQERALVVARDLGVEPEPPLLRSLAIASLTRGDFEAARRLGAQLRSSGERDDDDVLFVEGQYVLGVAAFWQGDFHTARTHLESAVQRYRPEHRAAHLSRYGQDPKVVCLSRLGNTLWFLGHPDAARQASDAALSLAVDIGHPYSRAVAHVFGALLALDMGDKERVRHHADEFGAGTREGHAPQVQLFVDALDGYVSVLEDRKEEGLASIRQALDAAADAGAAPGFEAALMRLLLAACEAGSCAQAGLAATQRAIGMRSGGAVWEAESRRLHAEFMAASGTPRGKVEKELERALDVARRQGAVSLERKVAASLRRYRQAG